MAFGSEPPHEVLPHEVRKPASFAVTTTLTFPKARCINSTVILLQEQVEATARASLKPVLQHTHTHTQNTVRCICMDRRTIFCGAPFAKAKFIDPIL